MPAKSIRAAVVAALLSSLPATIASAENYMVDTTLDVVAVDGLISLREALTAAVTNAPVNEAPAGDPGLDTIEFQIPGLGPHLILLTSPLPVITDPVTIDGLTQPSTTAIPIQIDGAAGGVPVGLSLAIDGSTISGLSITGFNTVGILMDNADDNHVFTCFVGLTPLGLAGPNGVGIDLMPGSEDNIFGTDGDGAGDASEGNVTSSNTGPGIAVSDSDGNTIAGNRIGTDPTGTVAMGNAGHGILLVNGAEVTTVGTNGDGLSDGDEGNVISGNLGNGVLVANDGNSSDTAFIRGNIIGLAIDGDTPLGNFGNGVAIVDAVSNRIGTNGDGVADAAEGNVISANGLAGIFISDSRQNQVRGNRIGTDITGTLDRGNGTQGIVIDDSDLNEIGTDGDGTSDELERNVIAGNGIDGILVFGPTSENNEIYGNRIGTNAAGTAAIPNDDDGIQVNGGAFLTRIGRDFDGSTARSNLISGNADNGILIEDAATERNIITGNFIGTDVTGTFAIPNGDDGINIQNDTTMNRVGVGGNPPAVERNLISGNLDDGIDIGEGADENVVAGNFIGTDVTGKLAIPNGDHGVEINDADENVVGIDGDGFGDDDESNIISGNDQDGVSINNESDRNVIAGNLIGVNCDGDPLGNGDDGVQLADGSSGNRIGSNRDGVSDEIERNVIAFNGEHGVQVISPDTDDNSISRNSIFSNVALGIDINDDGPTPNDDQDPDDGANQEQNHPEICFVDLSTGSIRGTFNSRPNVEHTLEFYSNTEADPSGFGEGETYLTSIDLTTDPIGNASFEITTLLDPAMPWITAIAIDPDGNTSEFSNAVTIERPHPGWNRVSTSIMLTPNQPTYWSAFSGTGSAGVLNPVTVAPFPSLDPDPTGFQPGRPCPDGELERCLRGYIVAWAVDAEDREIAFDQLSGSATLVNYDTSAAWEYQALAHQSVGPVNGDGTLDLDGNEFAPGPDLLLLDFYVSDALINDAWIVEGDLTLHPIDVDLTQGSSPLTTKAVIDVWNENEVKFDGLDRCITCWDQTLFRNYAGFGVPNNLVNLQTDKGKARIDGRAGDGICDIFDETEGPCGTLSADICGVDAALAGLQAKLIRFDGGRGAAGSRLVGMGTQSAQVQYTPLGSPPTATAPRNRTRSDRSMRPGGRTVGTPAAAAGPGNVQDRASGTEKGSVLFFSKVELRWNKDGVLIQDTFISLINDATQPVQVDMYFINGDEPLDGILP